MDFALFVSVSFFFHTQGVDVIADDYTFTTLSGLMRNPYGTARDAYAGGDTCLKGYFLIDLSGSGFYIHPNVSFSQIFAKHFL